MRDVCFICIKKNKFSVVCSPSFQLNTIRFLRSVDFGMSLVLWKALSSRYWRHRPIREIHISRILSLARWRNLQVFPVLSFPSSRLKVPNVGHYDAENMCQALNESKTKALWLGPWRQRTERPLNFIWMKELLKVLAIHISYNKAGNERKNVNQKIENLNAKLGTWRSHQLSISGRCLIVKSLGISQIVHSAAVLDIHKDYIAKIQSSIFKFIWKEKQDKIKRVVLYQDYERGGLRVSHIETLCKALHLA